MIIFLNKVIAVLGIMEEGKLPVDVVAPALNKVFRLMID